MGTPGGTGDVENVDNKLQQCFDVHLLGIDFSRDM